MKLTPKLIVALCVITMLSFACTKKKGTSSCTATLYGSKHTGMDTTFTFGVINSATGTSPGIASYHSRMLNAQGAFNPTDNCYYMLGYDHYFSTKVKLYKIDLAGAVTTYAPSAADTFAYTALAYNKVTNKLYCLKKTSATSSKVVEIIVVGSTYSTTPLASTVHPATPDILAYMTVDNNTGNIYFGTQDDTTTYYVEKYTPGASATTVVAAGTTGWTIFGLRFNPNDNMLYGIRNNSPATGYNLIKVNPSASTITDIALIASGINEDFYSTTLDPCSNRYLISTLTGSGWSTHILGQLDMSGTVLQSDVIPYSYMGMDVKY
jgi:hypothetical protein